MTKGIIGFANAQAKKLWESRQVKAGKDNKTDCKPSEVCKAEKKQTNKTKRSVKK